MQNSGWQQLIARVHAQIPQLLADFLTELEQHDDYREHAVNSQDVEHTATQAFEIFLERLETTDPLPHGAEFADRLGRRRARQGVPFASFLEAVRINFRVLWRALERAAQPDLLAVLVENGERVLAVVEWYATEVQRAYLAEAELLERQHRSTRERAIARLFSERLTAADAAEVAATLGVESGAEYEFLAMHTGAGHGSESASSGPRPPAGSLAYDDGEHVFWFRQRRGQATLPDGDPSLSGVYLARVPGLAALNRAAALTKRIAVSVDGEAAGRADGTAPPRIHTLVTAFGALASDAIGEAVAGFEYELLGSFAEAPDDERERLTATVRTFVECGSVQRTSEALFLHRNTVFNRLKQFESLTGLDVTVPRDAVVALVLLR
ncbi:helix-turn-helix domain-containing protein [Leucobacter albus]|uniref:Helix-turn-helix domain-containing protein n=1 Tax=Leucobacter albus TaxID=272210 RepID=A0ABW3TK36_9MICO